jgi:hypothetical protein
MPGPALTVQINGDPSDLTAALDQSQSSVRGFSGGISKAMVGIGLAAGAAVAGVKVLTDLTLAAGEDAAEQARLEKAIQNSGAAVGDWQSQVDAAIKSGQEKAFTDTEVREALQQLTTQTGSLDTAMGLLTTAQDLARAGGTDLAAATDAVARASEGSYRGLLAYGIAADEGATAADVLAEAQKAGAGQADLYAASAEGMATRASIGFSEVGESIGAALLPAMDKLLPALLPIIEALGELVTAILPLLIPLIGLFAQALGVVVDWLVAVFDGIKKVVDWLITLQARAQAMIDGVFATLTDVLTTIRDWFDNIGEAIGALMKPLQDLADLIANTFGKVGELASALGNLPDVIPSGFRFPWEQGGAFGGPEGGGITQGGGGDFRGGGGMSVSIVTGADPGSVSRAIRTYSRRNGGGRAFRRNITSAWAA